MRNIVNSMFNVNYQPYRMIHPKKLKGRGSPFVQWHALSNIAHIRSISISRFNRVRSHIYKYEFRNLLPMPALSPNSHAIQKDNYLKTMNRGICGNAYIFLTKSFRLYANNNKSLSMTIAIIAVAVYIYIVYSRFVLIFFFP